MIINRNKNKIENHEKYVKYFWKFEKFIINVYTMSGETLIEIDILNDNSHLIYITKIFYKITVA